MRSAMSVVLVWFVVRQAIAGAPHLAAQNGFSEKDTVRMLRDYGAEVAFDSNGHVQRVEFAGVFAEKPADKAMIKRLSQLGTPTK